MSRIHFLCCGGFINNLRMKKVIQILTLLCSLIFASSCKKEYKVISNENPFGTLIGDGNPHTIGEVIQTNDDQYLICGTAARGENGMCDGYLMKLDDKFNVLWYKNFGGTNQDFFENLAVDESGNILAAGNSFSYGISLDSSVAERNNLIYMVYVDRSGKKLWEKTHQARDTIGVINYRNEAYKVLYLKNNKFCLGGITSNYNSDLSFDGYVFGLDNKGEIEWSSNYFDDPLPPSGGDYEFIDDMVLNDDGTIALMFQSPNSTGTQNGKIITIPSDPRGYQKNRTLSKGLPLLNMSGNPFDQKGKIPMKSLPGEKYAIVSVYNPNFDLRDTVMEQLFVTDKKGSILFKTTFQHFINEPKITVIGEHIMLAGFYVSNLKKFPCWVMTDLTGKILSEVYYGLELCNPDKLKFSSTFINKKGEVITFGILTDAYKSFLLVLKSDTKGVIK